MPASETEAPSESESTLESHRLRVLFDHLPAMSAYWDRDQRNVVANRAYLSWFGLSPEDMKGRHLREVLGESVYAMNLPYVEGVLAGEEQLFDRTLVDVSGATRHTQASYVPDIFDGEVIGFGVLVTDVTPRVEAQRQMDEAQRLAELGSWTMNPDTTQITWSAEMYRIAGQDPADFRPSYDALVSLVHPDDRDQVMAAAAEARTNGTGYDLDYRLVRQDGEVREVHSRVHAELAQDGTVTRVTGILQDVTSSNRLSRALVRVNEELQQVNQLNADVLGVVGHDVRQPLGLILGQLEVLTETWQEFPQDVNLTRVEKALGAARRLAVLLDDILAMASFESGAIATRPVRVPLAEVLTDALAGVEGAADVEVRRFGDPTGFVDPFHLRQMVTNLVTNALRYGAPPVVVTLAAAGETSTIEVTDEGAGVPEEFVPHLYERFARPVTGVSTRKPGSGFGLYIVGRLAQANDCRITYEPRRPAGSRFTLEVPAVSP